jgi:(2S)-methylsuccinyl-CoA dehydrogenase
MPVAAVRKDTPDNLVARCVEIAGVAEALLADATLRVRERIAGDVKLIDREQRAAHGLAWLATYVEAIRQLNSALTPSGCRPKVCSARPKS